MKFVRRELSVREDRLFHSIRASFAGIIPCKKKKVPLSETDDGIFYHTNHRFFIEQLHLCSPPCNPEIPCSVPSFLQIGRSVSRKNNRGTVPIYSKILYL